LIFLISGGAFNARASASLGGGYFPVERVILFVGFENAAGLFPFLFSKRISGGTPHDSIAALLFDYETLTSKPPIELACFLMLET
jgi:hypothetical protein